MTNPLDGTPIGPAVDLAGAAYDAAGNALVKQKKSAAVITINPAEADKKDSLSQKEWAELWLYYKGPREKADMASAIVMAESGGRTKVYNGICCTGGYQFNSNTVPKACAAKPSCATKKAIAITGGGKNWSKWETFTNGAYKSYLGKSGIAGVSSETEVAGVNTGSVTGGIGDIVGFISRLFEPSFWLRVGKGLVGLILVLMGLQTLSKILIGIDPVNIAQNAGLAAALK